jgi:hypothetical protein
MHWKAVVNEHLPSLSSSIIHPMSCFLQVKGAAMLASASLKLTPTINILLLNIIIRIISK